MASAASKVPYFTSPGTLTKALGKIKEAAEPPRFTQDYLSDTLGMKGGAARPVIPFLKKSGFLEGDGTPTPQYKEFRNASRSGAAAAQALRTAYSAIFEVNEQAQSLSDAELKAIIIQITGLEAKSSAVTQSVGTFKALREFADFDSPAIVANGSQVSQIETDADEDRYDTALPSSDGAARLQLGYTITLNLPATTDISVYNAIFRSLRENLL